jgi:biotin transport system permease protein
MLTLTSPLETPLHRLSAGLKLGCLALGTMAILPLRDPVLVALAVLVVVALYLAQGWAFASQGLRPLRVLWPFVLVLLVWHGLTGDIAAGIGIAARMVAAVALANLVTMTTPLSAMIKVMEGLTQRLSFGSRRCLWPKQTR